MSSKNKSLYARSLNAMVDLLKKVTPRILKIDTLDKKLDSIATDSARILRLADNKHQIDFRYFKRVKELEARNNNLVDQMLELQSDNAKLFSDNKRLITQNFLYWHELKTYVPEHEWFTQGFDDKPEDQEPPEPEEDIPADKKSAKSALEQELQELRLTKDKKIN